MVDFPQVCVSTPAYLGPVTSTYTVRNTERYPFSILPFGVTAMRAAVGRLHYCAIHPSHPSIIEAAAMASRADRFKENGPGPNASVCNDSLPPLP